MNTNDFKTIIEVSAKPHQVFDAINNVREWWSENIDGETSKPGAIFDYHYQDIHICKIKITQLVPGKKVVWHVLDNHFNFTKDKSEWTGTDIIFDISETGGKTQLTFTHKGLTPAYECYHVCHDAWTHYIQGSLQQMITTGKGKPTPKDTGAQNTGTSVQSTNTATQSIYHRLLIQAPAETVYEAITTREGLAGWWTPATKATPEVGAVMTFAFDDYEKEIKIEELKPYSKVKWLCLKAFPDWIGTTITFELEPYAKGTILFFHHDGWAACTPEFASCSFDWALFLRSLKLLCETGKGVPYPEINKIGIKNDE